MQHFCTLFDSFYLSRGLAMYESLKQHSPGFHLYILAFDDLSYSLLHSVNLEYATIIPLSDFETDELKEVKKDRTLAEYCWTCTPSSISFVMKNFNLSQCTYIDADLYFYSDPSALISEMQENGKSVLITEHRFSTLPKLHGEQRAGRFCVQFITFGNDDQSLFILDKWRRECIDWCYSRYEDGKFGDQKYLDDWPLSYSNVHILHHLGGGIAPWNLTQYRFNRTMNSITGRTKSTGTEFNVVFFHFQYVKFIENGSYDVGWYYISSDKRKIFYTPYLEKVDEIERRLHNLNTNYETGFTNFKANGLKNILKTGFKKIFGYNIIKKQISNGISY